MSGKLVASLFLPYAIVSILGAIADYTFSGDVVGPAEQLANNILDADVGTGSEANAGGFDIKSGYAAVTGAGGLAFGWMRYVFTILSLDYAFWSSDSPWPYQTVRWLLVFMGLPAVVVIMYRSLELFARFISALGNAVGKFGGLIGLGG